ncbi:unnamed protein product [Dicrocoelium dendriticum]|nr:unnamed protein product [Dicrocoelium dendriticum]
MGDNSPSGKNKTSVKFPSLADKEERLRLLRLLVHYENDPDMMKLEALTQKWNRAARKAITELQQIAGTKGLDQFRSISRFSADPELLNDAGSDSDV